MAIAFDTLETLGWIGAARPRFLSVQPTGCAPIVHALKGDASTCAPWGQVSTVTGGMRNTKPFADRLLLRTIRASGGGGVAVTDDEILRTMALVHRMEGLQIGPEGAATLAALRRALDAGLVRPDETVVFVNTSSGLKYGHLLDERTFAYGETAAPASTAP
jgi:threonine synthase